MSGCCRGLPAKVCIARPYGCGDEPAQDSNLEDRMKKKDFNEGLSIALDIAKDNILKNYDPPLLRGGVVQRAYATDTETGDMIAVVLSVLTVPKEEVASWKKRAAAKAKGDKP